VKRRKIASLVIAATCIAGLSACDRHAPDVSISLAVRNNADGTTTVTGLAADQDQAGTKLLVVVTVDDGDVALVATVASVAPTHAAVTSNAPGASSLTVNERNDTAQNVTRAAPRRNADR